MKPYWTKWDQLTIENNILLWGMKVVVPVSPRSKVLEELHEGHPGMNRMKQLARSHVWWLKIDSDIKKAIVNPAKKCVTHHLKPYYTPGCGLQTLGLESMWTLLDYF